MLTEEWIRHKAHEVVYKSNTHNPFRICEDNSIPIYYDNLGKQIMAYHTTVKRIPAIVLSTCNTDFENFYSCSHELGHHFCRHKGNTECLNRNNRKFVTFGEEYEANKFMTDLLLDNVNIRNFDTKQHLMQYCHIPLWAERYINWDLLLN